jgi:hypothetical protein
VTMPNGQQPGAPIHMHVAPGPTAYEVGVQTGMSPTGPVKVVVIRIEHATGSSVFVVPTDFASQLGHDIIKAASGIEIAKGF